MLSLDRPRFTTRTVAYDQKQEFSIDCKIHCQPSEAPRALATAVSACLNNALDGRELVGGTVDIKLHVKDQLDSFVAFTERPMCAAEQAVRAMDTGVARWRENLARRGSVEIFIGAIVKCVLDTTPAEWCLEQRRTHLQVRRERELVDGQGFDASQLRAFDFRKYRAGQIMLTPAAARLKAVQHKLVKSIGRAVPYPLAAPCREVKKEVADPEFAAIEKQPTNF